MLIFIDQPKQIRVVKSVEDNGAQRRSPIGRVMKNTYEISDDLRAALSAEEIGELEQVIEAYKHAESVRLQSLALQFPATARETMDFFEDKASETERRLIVCALMEAVRRMRKFSRVAAD